MSPGGGVRTGASFSTASPAAGGASALRACACASVRAQRVVFRLLLVAGQSSLVWTSVLCTFVPLGVDRSRFHASAMANNPAVNPHLCEPPFPLLWGARRGAELLGPVAVPGFALFRFIFFLSFGSSFPETPDVSPLIRSSLGRTPWDLAVSSGRLRGPPPLRRRRRSPGMRETPLPGEPPGPPRCAAGLRALLSVLTSPRSPCLSLSRGAHQAPHSCHCRPHTAITVPAP